jgi:hypothetical protein
MKYHYSRKFYLDGCVYEIVGCENVNGTYYTKFVKDEQMFRKNYDELAEMIHSRGHYLKSDKHGTPLTTFENENDLPLKSKSNRSTQKQVVTTQERLF